MYKVAITRTFVTCSLQQILSVIDSKTMRWIGHVACNGEVGKPEGKAWKIYAWMRV
jgi:hypothetical protein